MPKLPFSRAVGTLGHPLTFAYHSNYHIVCVQTNPPVYRSIKCLQTLIGHKGRVTCVAISADNTCVSGSRDGTLRVWDYRSGACFCVLEGHSAPINCVTFTEDGLCVSCSDDKTVRVWDLQKHECIYCSREHDARITCLAALSEGGCGQWG